MSDIVVGFGQHATTSGYVCWRRSKAGGITSRDRRWSIAPDPAGGYTLTDHKTTGRFSVRTQDDAKRLASQVILRELTGA